ncbi:glycosyl transferase [Nonlabens spongiae]|uniref:Glycosyl transferase n=1 Tax=Nonlabens spongiae TaxID=331648 RepID=A0A1W6MJ75_9FLAO|nr:glycosyltransferase [Nonlabens spongiae]ARN77633.1 glycosyl transferase [Nonlabens spongiae]
MRILLVGEYSGFHNALKHGLETLGHEVTIVGDGDGFKNYPVDIKLYDSDFEKSWFKQKFRNLIKRFTKKDLRDAVVLSRFRESENLLKDHDVVQFINSNAFNTEATTERKMIDFLLENNSKSLLVACGDDTDYVRYLVNDHEGYSILDPYKNEVVPKAGEMYTLRYLKKEYAANYELIKAQSSAVVPSNTDYRMPLVNDPKATPIIPAPVQTHRLKLEQNEDLSTIKIFMGINRHNYWKKGINYFKEALKVIQKKYGGRVAIKIAENLPYAEYIKSYKECHIFLDQVLCYDQGYNALEAMAMGKVVFAGASNLYLEAHGLNEIPAIDAKPDVDYLIDKISELIDQPELILEIGKKARKHVLEYHGCKRIAQKYEKIYLS